MKKIKELPRLLAAIAAISLMGVAGNFNKMSLRPEIGMSDLQVIHGTLDSIENKTKGTSANINVSHSGGKASIVLVDQSILDSVRVTDPVEVWVLREGDSGFGGGQHPFFLKVAGHTYITFDEQEKGYSSEVAQGQLLFRISAVVLMGCMILIMLITRKSARTSASTRA